MSKQEHMVASTCLQRMSIGLDPLNSSMSTPPVGRLHERPLREGELVLRAAEAAHFFQKVALKTSRELHNNLASAMAARRRLREQMDRNRKEGPSTPESVELHAIIV